MKRRERKWTKKKLLIEPESHPILGLWSSPEISKILKKRGEKGLHFNDLRYLLCKDWKDIKRPPKDWERFQGQTLRGMREYNDYTILQKDLTKLCDMGFLKKAARGYYTPVSGPVMQYIQDITFSGKSIIGTNTACDIVATEAFELPDDIETECGILFRRIMEARARSYESSILKLWKEVDSSKLDLQQKIILRNELYPLAANERLRRFFRRSCLVTTDRGRETFDISPFRKRNAEKMKGLIALTDRYSEHLGIHAVKYALGIYTFPKIFTEKYVQSKGTAFKKELVPFMEKLKSLQLELGKPCYVLLAPKQ
jgi:hypothetical protein